MLPKVDRGKIEEHKQEFQAAIPMIEYYREIGEEGYLKHFKEKICMEYS